jgi:hypothetical protein
MLSITHIRWHEQFFTFWLLQFEMLKIFINVTRIIEFYTILQTSDEIAKNSLVLNLNYFHQISHQGNITWFRYVKVKSITWTLQIYWCEMGTGDISQNRTCSMHRRRFGHDEMLVIWATWQNDQSSKRHIVRCDAIEYPLRINPMCDFLLWKGASAKVTLFCW